METNTKKKKLETLPLVKKYLFQISSPFWIDEEASEDCIKSKKEAEEYINYLIEKESKKTEIEIEDESHKISFNQISQFIDEVKKIKNVRTYQQHTIDFLDDLINLCKKTLERKKAENIYFDPG